MKALFLLLVAVLFLFLLAPVLLVIPLSFSAAANLSWPPPGWSLRWYRALLSAPGLLDAARNSLVLAAAVTTVSLLFGMPAAFALERGGFPGRGALQTLLSAPLLLPTIVLGLALLTVLVGLGLLGSWAGLLLAHLTVTLPYAIRVLSTALATLPPALEDAARSLGAPPAAVFRRITLPLLLPGVAATAALAFLVSFDEVVISLFAVGPDLTTLPVFLYHYVESRTDPLVAAVSTLLVVLTVAVVLLLDRLVGLRRAVGGERGGST